MLTQAVLGNKNGFHKYIVEERKANQKIISLISNKKMNTPVFLQSLSYPLTFFLMEKKRKKDVAMEK